MDQLDNHMPYLIEKYDKKEIQISVSSIFYKKLKELHFLYLIDEITLHDLATMIYKELSLVTWMGSLLVIDDFLSYIKEFKSPLQEIILKCKPSLF